MKKVEEFLTKYKKIIFIGLFICVPLISKKFILGHDSLYHFSNIEALVTAIKDFNFTQITPLIANNFGYGSAIFYPKLPHYFLTIFSLGLGIFGFGIKTAISLGNILTIILSGIFMFKLLDMLFHNKKVSLVGSSVYITMPYFISDIFVRSALNESFLYIFMPLVLIGLIYLYQNNIKKFYLYFIIGYVGMMGSHLVLSVYFTILVCIVILINLKKIFIKDRFKHLVIASIILLILIMPKAILMIEHKNLNIYGVFNPELMGSTVSKVKSYTLTLKDFFVPNIYSNGINYFINIIVILLGIFATYYLLFKEKNKDKKSFVFSIIIFLCFSIFLSTKLFPYKLMPKLLLSIQFASRNHLFTCFALSILCSYGLNIVIQKYKKASNVINFILITSSCFLAILIVNNATYIEKVVHDTYAGMGVQKEYLTTNALKNIDYLENRGEEIKILSDNNNIKIKVIKNKVPELKFKIFNIKKNENVELELPRLYYLGYDIQQQNNKKVEKINYKNSKNGFIKIKVKNNGIVTVNYKGTRLYRFFYNIRLIFIWVFIIVIFIRSTKNNITKIQICRNK